MGIPAARIDRTASIIGSFGPRPANSRSIRPSGPTPISAPNRASNSASSSSPFSSERSRAGPSPSARKVSLIAPGSRPSSSQKARNESQMLLVSTPPKSTSSPCGRCPLTPGLIPAPASTRSIGLAAVTDSGDSGTPEGIDRGGVESWFEANLERVELPLSFEMIAGGRSNLTYCGRRRRRPALGAAAPAARQAAWLGPRHGPRAQGRLGARRHAGPGPPDRRLLRGRERSTRRRST